MKKEPNKNDIETSQNDYDQLMINLKKKQKKQVKSVL